MYEYADYCPLAATTSVLGDYWTPLIVRELLYGTTHFNQVARNLPSISRSLLADRLRKLEHAGVVARARIAANATSYALTNAGRDLQGVIDALSGWGTRWGANRADPQALDPAMAVCMMKDRMHAETMPGSPIVMEVVATGERDGRAWVVCEGQSIAMCFEPPPYDVNLWVHAPARVLYAVWLGEISMQAAIRRGDVALHGDRELVRAFAGWFGPAGAPKAPQRTAIAR